MLEWFVGFYDPKLRNHNGKIFPRGWFGHVEVWGYTEDDTWLFYDPQSNGTKVVVIHKHDDVLDHLTARHCLCDAILRLPAIAGAGPFNFYLPMTCASIVSNMLGVRAFTPWGLKRKLLANGAEVIHENPERRSG